MEFEELNKINTNSTIKLATTTYLRGLNTFGNSPNSQLEFYTHGEHTSISLTVNDIGENKEIVTYLSDRYDVEGNEKEVVNGIVELSLETEQLELLHSYIGTLLKRRDR